MAVVIFILIGFSIMVIVGYKIFGDLNTDIQADADLNATAKNITSNLYDRYPATMDGGFVLIIGLLWLFVLISSALVDSHPMFLVIAIFLLIFALAISMLLSNTFQDFSDESDFSGFEASFPMMYYVMDHLLIFVIAVGVSTLIVMYAKSRFT